MALQRDYPGQVCSVASALEVVGERWTLLIVRDLLLGLRRFDELQADLGVARNVLQARLELLVAHGVVERRPYQERPPRHEYRLTPKGEDLAPVLHALMRWGDAHAPRPGGPPVLVEHRGCGGAVDAHWRCSRCGRDLGPGDAEAVPGPGAGPDHPVRLAAASAA
ncbi:helix-turn-helix domain-containing protein [Patulibacter sp. SYSU D01012]|uniref:winged helix-turn-helix transcriptional regulator n=1 Tax=Patulibacter sp. SYSU D01012 TaxID=2817381 RepID=UPI001B30084C|nr:helix-turn-helix domain-containing protein [Patulibacter sp. SYSU D01012]